MENIENKEAAKISTVLTSSLLQQSPTNEERFQSIDKKLNSLSFGQLTHTLYITVNTIVAVCQFMFRK